MAVRNLQELGINLQKIVTRLLENSDLRKLLYHTDANPLEGPEVDKEQIYQKLIKIVPKVGTKNNAQSLLAVYVAGANGLTNNNEFKQVKIKIDVYTPLTQWIIKDTNLRPFSIMGQIQKSLNDKTVNGLGKLKCGDFHLIMITEDVSCYQMDVGVVEYD